MKSSHDSFTNASVIGSLNFSFQQDHYERGSNWTTGLNDSYNIVPLASHALTLKILLGVFCVTVTSVGLPLSVLIVTTIASFRELRTNQNAFVASLAFRDILLVGVFLPFFYADFVVGVYPFGDTVCVIHMTFVFSTSLGSVMELMNIAVSRYVRICCRITTYRNVYTRRNTIFFIFLTWSLSFICGTPVCVLFGTLSTDTHSCFISKSRPKAIVVVIIFVTAMTVTSFCYLNIWRTVQTAKENLKRFNEGPRRHRTVQYNFQTFIRDFAVFIVYVFFLLPFVLLNSFGLSSPGHLAWEFAKLMSYTNNFTNCLLYGLLNRQIRSRFYRLLTCSKHRQRTNVVSPYTITVTGGMSRTPLSFGGPNKGSNRTTYIFVSTTGETNNNNNDANNTYI